MVPHKSSAHEVSLNIVRHVGVSELLNEVKQGACRCLIVLEDQCEIKLLSVSVRARRRHGREAAQLESS